MKKEIDFYSQSLTLASQIVKEWYEESLQEGETLVSITEAKLVTAVNEELKEEINKVLYNTLQGKQTRIDGKKIMEKVKKDFTEKAKKNFQEFKRNNPELLERWSKTI